MTLWPSNGKLRGKEQPAILFAIALLVPLLSHSAWAIPLASAGGASACPLQRKVASFDAQDSSRVAALLDFARQKKISIGITGKLNGPDDRIALHLQNNSVRSALGTILGSPSSYSLICVWGTILAVDVRRPPAWLNVRIAHLKITPIAFGMANARLGMEVETKMQPAQQGFAGDLLGNAGPLIETLDLRNATARTALCHLANQWPGTVWIAGDVSVPGRTAWSNSLWTLFPPED